MYPRDLPTPPDVHSTSPGCPDCGSQWGMADLAHGVPAYGDDPGDRSLSGLLCLVQHVQRGLLGDLECVEGAFDPEYASDLLGQALARFRGER